MQRRERAGRAAELHRQARPGRRPAESRERSSAAAPHRGQRAERRGDGLLQQRAARHRGVAMGRGQARARAPHSSRSATDHAERARRDQHQRGVEDVLAGRAEMHGARGLGAGSRLDTRAQSRRPAGSPGCRRRPSAGPARRGPMRRTRRTPRRSRARPAASIRPARAQARASAVSASHSASSIARVVGRGDDRGRAEDAVEAASHHGTQACSDREERCLAPRPAAGCRSAARRRPATAMSSARSGSSSRAAPGRPRWRRPRPGSRCRVTSCLSSPRANTVTSMCGACSSSTRPGFSVRNQ